jgi:hypothetical protein
MKNEKISAFVSRYILLIIIILFSYFNFSQASSENNKSETSQNYSNNQSNQEIIPRIDDEAACVVRECKGKNNEAVVAKGNAFNNKYSINFWTFLFGTYIFLLIFNLSFGFGKKRDPQWFWEAVYTYLAIFVWDKLDPGRINPWFPGVVLESGIIIYLFYFYLLSKKNNSVPKNFY